jgi:hypothetical protein
MRVLVAFSLVFLPLRAQLNQDLDQVVHGILQKNCLACHGAATSGGLDLRTRETALKGGTRGPALVPGQADNSLLYRAIRQDGELAMPPGRAKLPSKEVDAIRAWIERGASWKGTKTADESVWWSFRKLARPPMPPPSSETNPIDAFVLSKLTNRKLRPVPLADRRVLIRRVTFDLHGLPPAPEDVERFVADPDPLAYERLIDKLLASPRYGERWGRHWLDVVRYADTGGFETDIYFPNAWRYRDYVIKSFNDDKPWNTFVQEQVAGDELWPGDIDYEGTFEIPEPKLRKLEARIGTGMYTIGPVYHEAALFEGQAKYEWLTDAVDTTGEAFLGLTVGCARCHDHKFDALTQKDYHAMMALFAGSEEREIPVVPRFSIYGFKSGYPNWLKVEEIKSAIGRIDKAARQRVVDKVRSRFANDVLAAYDVPKDKRTDQQRKIAAVLELAMTEEGLLENAEGKQADLSYTEEESALRTKLVQQLGQAALKANPVMQTATVLGHSGWTPLTHLTRQGDWRATGDVVKPAFPAVLASGHTIDEPPNGRSALRRRTELALWLTSPDHPLTARVIVNRVWHWHFGRGIVGTPGDFGRQGDAPSHPELLDWLASEFVAQNWSLKKLQRLILLSDTYRRSSEYNAENAAIDAENRFLWRMNRQRVDAETLRDSVLAVSGSLNLKAGGRPVIPPLSAEEASGLWARDQWPESMDASEHDRRSVYLYVKRTFPLPMMSAFDSPDSSVSCSRRDSTTVAPQALTLLNSEFMLREATRFADELRKEHGSDVRRQVEGMWTRAFGRKPSAAEAQSAISALSDKADPDALARLCLVAFNTNEFVYID